MFDWGVSALQTLLTLIISLFWSFANWTSHLINFSVILVAKVFLPSSIISFLTVLTDMLEAQVSSVQQIF